MSSIREALAPVAWIDNSGHPKHLMYVQSATERKLYGPLRPLYEGAAQPAQEQPDLVLPEPIAHIVALKTADAGLTKFFTAPSDPRGMPVYSELQILTALAAQPAQAWVSVTERMPTAGVKVLVCYRNSYGNLRRTCAHYSPLHTVDASTWDEGEPDETEDGTFEPEGWWEEPVELERVEFIADEVTHWMPLPAPPESKP